MQQDVTYFLDEVSVSPGDRITFNQNDEKQNIGALMQYYSSHTQINVRLLV